MTMTPLRVSGGRQDEGGGNHSAPLVPHPVSRLLPSMTATEFADLCKDIKTHGLEDDILLLDGQILDGNHRYRACIETGVKPRFAVWEGDDPIAFVLSKNLHRRQLSAPQKAAVAVEAEAMYAAAARRRQLAGKADLAAHVPQGQTGQALEHAAKAVGASRRAAQDAKRVKARSPETFEKLKKGGLSVRGALKECGLKGGHDDGATPKPATKKPPLAAKKVPDHVAAQARIRAIDAELKYQSMLNAPEGKLNIPLLDRASKIQDILLEVTGLTPEQAVSGIPAVRCREYSLEMAQWWLRFAELCDERRRNETPALPPLYKRSRLASLNPVVVGGPVAPAVMSPATRAVYDWIAKQTEPVTVVEAAVAARINRTTAGDALRKLVQTGQVEVVGSVRSKSNAAFNLYRLKLEEGSDGPALQQPEA